MTIKQYQNEAKRTCPDLGSTLLNSLHMTIGMMTEIGEIASIFSEPSELPLDTVNLLEELADIQWYAANYASLHNLEYSDVRQKNVTYYEDEWPFAKVIKHASDLADFDKKLLAYGKPVDESNRKMVFDALYIQILKMHNQYDLNFEYGLERNIAKLSYRFPEKFDAEKAINRDVVTERSILENKTD